MQIRLIIKLVLCMLCRWTPGPAVLIKRRVLVVAVHDTEEFRQLSVGTTATRVQAVPTSSTGPMLQGGTALLLLLLPASAGGYSPEHRRRPQPPSTAIRRSPAPSYSEAGVPFRPFNGPEGQRWRIDDGCGV